MPFLDENEWAEISPLLQGSIESIKNYRSEHNCDLKTAKENDKSEAMLKFEELTGMKGIHSEIIYHHRLSDWGQECPKCQHLLRTSKAKYCANCGWQVEQNEKL